MIKMTATSKDGRTLVMLGLSEDNIQRMREGKPIHVFGAEMNLPVDVCVFWGATDEKLVEMASPLISEKTVVRDLKTNRPIKQ